MNETIPFGVPCKYMVYDLDGYHKCSMLGKSVLCLWFYDVLGTTISLEVIHNTKTGEKTIISDYNFPDKLSKKREKEPHISDVPKICPLGYSYDKINSKIQSLMKKPMGAKEMRK